MPKHIGLTGGIAMNVLNQFPIVSGSVLSYDVIVVGHLK